MSPASSETQPLLDSAAARLVKKNRECRSSRDGHQYIGVKRFSKHIKVVCHAQISNYGKQHTFFGKSTPHASHEERICHCVWCGEKKMGRNFSESWRVLHCRQLNRPVMTDRYSESLPKHGGDAFNHSAWGISMLYIY